MNDPVKVYGKSECVQCTWTVRQLINREIPYTYIDVEADATAKAYVLSQGDSLILPLVEVGDGRSWRGFHIDKIREINANDYS